MRKFIVFIFAAAVLLMSAPNGNALLTVPYTVDANTVALYHLDSETGGVTPDSVGNHDGVLYGNAQITGSGKFGSGLALDGNGDYVRLGNVHQNPVKDYTQGSVEAWVNLTGSPSYMVVLGSGTEYGNNWDDGWFLGRHGSYSDKLVFMIWNGGWNIASSEMTLESLVGGWHHLAGTWGSKGIEVWVDGVLKGTNPTNVAPSNPNYTTALIGTDSWTWATPGTIDEVRISDIQRDFTATAVPLPASLLFLAPGLAVIAGLRRKLKA
ncbi:MAG: hypothetical protein A4E70_00771 [Syntrophus sp. PtaU1.Bin005]|jgi:hypothetical protein|uniref:LamG-like jellyroll fold domain-containing protein n=1 Tax=Syntrophus TaxID=43773 RepID=UPI0009D408AF|nr:MAG: hypothetical protein A4E69_01647 [Syntrophus sp. PtaB.Bin138]OPY82336.1 MAG: hypothetical protein A4E70_00771 [Syntrophus sp. PtaU1.Bin005]